jgi:hypothetical protein
MNRVWDVLKWLATPLRSRKVRAAIAGPLVAWLAKKGLDVPDEIVIGILGVAVAYITGVAIEDHGAKSAGKASQPS